MPDTQRGEELLSLVSWQVGFGYRYPGSQEHQKFLEELISLMRPKVDRLYVQDFRVRLGGRSVPCANLIGLIRCEGKPHTGPLLLGAHFDTRMRADNEGETDLQEKPILGANDGGSGVAVLLHLLSQLQGCRFCRDILVVLFDAEDVGGIDGNRFATGAWYHADHPLPFLPEEVLVLDMVGGKGLQMELDAHIFHHPSSWALTERIFRLARTLGLSAFSLEKKERIKYIIADHYPYLMRDIPACILIDLDYPEWHTHRDLPDAMSAESLVTTEKLLEAYLAAFLTQ